MYIYIYIYMEWLRKAFCSLEWRVQFCLLFCCTYPSLSTVNKEKNRTDQRASLRVDTRETQHHYSAMKPMCACQTKAAQDSNELLWSEVLFLWLSVPQTNMAFFCTEGQQGYASLSGSVCDRLTLKKRLKVSLLFKSEDNNTKPMPIKMDDMLLASHFSQTHKYIQHTGVLLNYCKGQHDHHHFPSKTRAGLPT